MVYTRDYLCHCHWGPRKRNESNRSDDRPTASPGSCALKLIELLNDDQVIANTAKKPVPKRTNNYNYNLSDRIRRLNEKLDLKDEFIKSLSSKPGLSPWSLKTQH